MMNNRLILNALLVLSCIGFVPFTLTAQENYKEDKSLVSDKHSYQATSVYKVKSYDDIKFKRKPKNIILMIGDGMGISQIQAGMVANRGDLFLENFKNVGFSKTQSADRFVTDSGAGGTALACGVKSHNKGIGVDANNNPVKNVREYAHERKKATGVVCTSAVTHATPAAFVAHQPQRSKYEDIAADFLKTDIDLFIGGGVDHFENREDKQNLTKELKSKGYQVLYSMDQIAKVKEGKLAGLVAPKHLDKRAKRGNMLQVATKTALNILDNDKDGFFLMVEGSQIDWGCHQNNTKYIVNEVLDFDKTIGAVLEFASKNKNTLIIVTADHETGGMSIDNGNIGKQSIDAGFNCTHHSGVMVPVFAFGPCAKQFTGIMDNTDIANKIFELLK